MGLWGTKGNTTIFEGQVLLQLKIIISTAPSFLRWSLRVSSLGCHAQKARNWPLSSFRDQEAPKTPKTPARADFAAKGRNCFGVLEEGPCSVFQAPGSGLNWDLLQKMLWHIPYYSFMYAYLCIANMLLCSPDGQGAIAKGFTSGTLTQLP